MGEAHIKRIEEKDIPECVNVIRKSFLTIAERFGITMENAPYFTAFSTTNEKLKGQFEDENRAMYAYYEDGKIIGYYSLELLGKGICELNNLCVLPEYRHKKAGEKLLCNSFDAARSFCCKQMKVGIIEENEVLKQWYQSFGFVHTGTRKFDFFPFTCGYMEKEL